MMNKLYSKIFLGVFVLILIGNIASSALAATPTPDAEAASLCYGTMCCGSFTLIVIVVIIVVVVLIIAALAYLLMAKK